MSVNYVSIDISSDAISLSGTGIYLVDTQSNAATDDIATWSGASLHDVIELRPQVSGQWWTLRHNPSNHIMLIDGLDFTPASMADKIVLRVESIGGTNRLVEMVPRTHILTS